MEIISRWELVRILLF